MFKATFGLSSILGAALVVQPFRAVIVEGDSMAPTFRDGQLAFAVPLGRELRDGDIVLVARDGATLVKRIAMIGGDRYEEMYLPQSHSWEMVSTPAESRLAHRGLLKTRSVTVPPGKMFIIGDNPGVSYDSRFFGLVDTSSIRGLVVSGW